MFFRGKQPAEPTFQDRLGALQRAGFEASLHPDGRAEVSRDGCTATISDGKPPRIERIGRMIGGRIAVLTDAGYQKFWASGGERLAPALASQLKALHDFEEDLREALGVESLYNTSLGTTNEVHAYDRLAGR
jgi:hypothetical protein